MVLHDFRTYGEFIYTLPAHHPSIQQSTLVLANIGRTLSELEGQLHFAKQSTAIDEKENAQVRHVFRSHLCASAA